uniref:Uncharacterized protein n=1 Tax=Romanomermis culicivorax TaxID=13658 RepID=A0A915I6W1_ROMCU
MKQIGHPKIKNAETDKWIDRFFNFEVDDQFGANMDDAHQQMTAIAKNGGIATFVEIGTEEVRCKDYRSIDRKLICTVLKNYLYDIRTTYK